MKRIIPFRKILFSIICVGSLPMLYGQLYIDWQKSFNEADGEGFGIEKTKDGGYIAVGAQFNNGNQTWLIKLDSDGNILWSKTFAENEYGDGRAVAETEDGGYIVVGEGGSGICMIKTDSDGNELWTKTYDEGYPMDIEQTRDGGYLVLGDRLFKTDISGNLLWTNDSISGRHLQQTADEGFIITGEIWVDEDNNIIETPSNETDHTDISLIKTDSYGDTLWTQIFGGVGINSYDWGNHVQQTEDGGYIVAAGIDWNHWGFSSGYIIKTNSEGVVQWATIDTMYSSENIQLLDDGSYLVMGDSRESDYYNICLSKIDEQGNKLWTKYCYQDECGWYRNGTATNDNGFIMIGGINAEDSYDVHLWIVKVRLGAATVINTTESEKLKIFPNPTRSLLTVETDLVDSYSIEFYSLNGQLIFNREMEGTTHQIDLSSFQSGVYLITIRSKDFVTMRKIIKL